MKCATVTVLGWGLLFMLKTLRLFSVCFCFIIFRFVGNTRKLQRLFLMCGEYSVVTTVIFVLWDSFFFFLSLSLSPPCSASAVLVAGLLCAALLRGSSTYVFQQSSCAAL